MTRVTKDFDTSKFTGILLRYDDNYSVIEPYKDVVITRFDGQHWYRIMPDIRREWFHIMELVVDFFKNSVPNPWNPGNKPLDVCLTLFQNGNIQFVLSLNVDKEQTVMLAGLIADFIVHFAAIADKQPKLKYLKLGDNYYFVNGNSFKGIIPQGAWTYSFTIQFESYAIDTRSYVVMRIVKMDDLHGPSLYGYVRNDEGNYVYGQVCDGSKGFVVCCDNKLLLFDQNCKYGGPEEFDISLVEPSELYKLLSAEQIDSILNDIK